ncbi:MAG: Hsp20/alpha crystallin family protein [Deltaproteobacteria bacterium]|nr:Hsp20/alpha crystallin family protein [Deltaproteobacteria bacterium]
MKKEDKEGLLGGLFKGLGSLIDLADKVSKEGGVLEKSGEFNVPGEKEAKGVYGFTIRTMAGPGGTRRPIIQPFGNIKKTPKGPVVEETREPIIDIFEEGNTIQIVAELPGVTEQEIHYEVHGDVVALSTTGKRKYNKEILLKSPVEENNAQFSYRNGMMELKLKKKIH